MYMPVSSGPQPSPAETTGGVMLRPPLCLTCASSLPPTSLINSAGARVFTTPCCKRVICANCISRNPRLRAYDPCLACLAGVDATAGASPSNHLVIRSGGRGNGNKAELLFDADVRGSLAAKSELEAGGVILENEMFTIGDSDDEDDDEGRRNKEQGLPSTLNQDTDASDTPPRDSPPEPPPYSKVGHAEALSGRAAQPAGNPTSTTTEKTESITHSSPFPVQTQAQITQTQSSASENETFASLSDPTKYFIQPKDTLSGVSLKLGIDGRRLARLNHLPPSTLTTTPHLLHTRRYLTLPANARILSSISIHDSASTDNDDNAKLLVLEREKELERARARERAEKRFAFVTKEVDYHIAKAYVAITDEFSEDESDFPHEGSKQKAREKEKAWTTTGVGGVASTGRLEARAIERYLDDEEWEQRELKAGRSPRPPSFALGTLCNTR